MSFSWQPIKEVGQRRFLSRARFYPEAKLSLKQPDYTTEEAAAARLLVHQPTRAFLLRLAQIGKARSADAAQDVEGIPLEELRERGLLRKEFLVLCRKDNRTICTTESAGELETTLGSKLTCATCGRAFKDEIVQEIHAITDSARHLLSGSRWMSIWLTEVLQASGVKREAVHWNPEAGGDELDIMTDALGPRVFFELKDREFGLGDAYPFVYRVSRYGGGFGVVVSTDHIAEDAKKFFDEQSRSIEARIVLIEGAASIEAGVSKLVDQVSRSGVIQLIRELSEQIAFDPTALLNAWMDRRSPQ